MSELRDEKPPRRRVGYVENALELAPLAQVIVRRAQDRTKATRSTKIARLREPVCSLVRHCSTCCPRLAIHPPKTGMTIWSPKRWQATKPRGPRSTGVTALAWRASS